jgi:hypothetical protein
VNAGKGVGGIQITTPGGKEVTKVGGVGGASGPGGNSAVKGGSITNASGPGGSGTAISRGGAVSGPGGAAAGKSGIVSGPGGAAAGRAGIASGPGGTVAGAGGIASGAGGTVAGRAGIASGPGGVAGYRGGIAVGPGGAAAGRNVYASGARGTYYRSAGAIAGQGAYVRAGYAGYGNYFTRGWYAGYPGAWYPGKWAGAAAWAVAGWASLYAYGGSGGYYPEEPAYYDYGSEVVYQDEYVYVDGEQVATAEQYAEQATTIAETGHQAQADKEAEWLSLGVFAMVQGEETTSNNMFQLAVNKEGVIRGNYYNALTDEVSPVSGYVDQKTQRAAWMVGEKKTPIYEAGLANLTKDETTMMVHYGKDKSQQFTLFRIPQPEAAPMEGKQ